MFHKSAHKDVQNPSGQRRVAPSPGERLSDVIEGAMARSSEAILESPRTAYERGYADGWMEAQESLRKWQEAHRS